MNLRMFLAVMVLAVICPQSGFSQTLPAPAQWPVVRLTTSGAKNGQAFWSPDGSSISFVSNRSGSWQIWVMAANGRQLRQLTHSTEPVGWPSWAPDGDQLLYYAGGPAGYRLYRLELATGRVSQLLDEDARSQDFRPLLSPDGEVLLFDRFGASSPPNHDLFALHMTTGQLAQLTSDPGYDSDGRWSPDGTRIVFHSDRGAPMKHHTQVFIMDAKGRNLRQLTQGPARNGYPSWSPDGLRIAYIAEMAGNRDIWVMDAAGRHARRITKHSGFDGDPVWSPAGDYLLVSTDRFGGTELALIELKR